MDETTTADGYAIAAPIGERIRIPERVNRADDPYLRLVTAAQRRAYYLENGYVVMRNLVPAAACDAARAAYEREVKAYPGYLYRQASANPERHVMTASGHVLNSLLNIQDFDARAFVDALVGKG